jgi:hypothetical protein
MARAFFLRHVLAGPAFALLLPTLLGAAMTQAGVSTVTRVMPIGLVSNGTKSAAGMRGSLTGSVPAAIALYDGASDELLFAAVRREAPDALAIAATVSTAATVKAVADSIAERVRRGLERAMPRALRRRR